MKSWTLEKTTNLVIILTCLFTVAVMADRVRRADSRSASTPPQFATGSRAPTLENIDYRRYKHTIVTFVRSSCKFCTESMPLYQRIARATASDVQFIVASAEPISVTNEYLRTHGVVAGKVVRVEQTGPTPTMLLVNRAGIIEHTWVGLLDADREQTFLKTVGLKP
jgi:F plasmid transfer operon protein TraF